MSLPIIIIITLVILYFLTKGLNSAKSMNSHINHLSENSFNENVEDQIEN